MKRQESNTTNSKEVPMPSSGELRALTDYHWQRSKAAQKEAKEMSKHPYSYEEAKKQVETKYARRERSNKKA